jgi:hypothetical protein
MPSRFGNPRGSIGRILKEAGEISDARLRSTMAYLDDFTSVEDNPQKQIGGGGRLTRGQYTAMLQQSPDFRQQLANRWLFATPTERDSLLVHLREAFPGQGRAALGVPGLDDTGIPDDQTGTGLGGPPQGGQALGAGLGPAPMAGAAPVPPMGPPPPLDMNAAGPPGPAGPGLPASSPAPVGGPPGAPSVPIPQIGPRGVPMGTPGAPGLPGPGDPANLALPAPGLGPPTLPPPPVTPTGGGMQAISNIARLIRPRPMTSALPGV